jgi:hypothetical protein
MAGDERLSGRFWCVFGFHAWTAWGGLETDGDGDVFQLRTCLRCQMREAHYVLQMCDPSSEFEAGEREG